MSIGDAAHQQHRSSGAAVAPPASSWPPPSSHAGTGNPFPVRYAHTDDEWIRQCAPNLDAFSSPALISPRTKSYDMPMYCASCAGVHAVIGSSLIASTTARLPIDDAAGAEPLSVARVFPRS